MIASRPLVFALCTSVVIAGCASTDNRIQQLSLPKPLNVWHLGEPDLIVTLSEPYLLPSRGSDVFRNFVISNVAASDRYVRALDFSLDNRGVVHHAEFRLDESDASLLLDKEEPEVGFQGMGNTTAYYPDGYFLNWVPGKRASELQEGLAWRLPAQADLVVQLHMMPSDIEEIIDPQIGLYFADEPLGVSPQMIWLGSRWLPISAGNSNFTIRDSYQLNFDVDVLSVLPHCHYICKSISVWANLPNGSQQQLVTIEEWDFYKQKEFRYERPIHLPSGTTVSMEFSYDNSADNMWNPNNPPQDIDFGPLSSNEMADLWIQLMPNNDHDGAYLRQSSARHLQEKIIERQEKVVELQPDVDAHIELAQSYHTDGQLSEVVAQYQEALKIVPESAAVLSRLAVALTDVGRHNEALVHWRHAVELAPNDSRTRVNFAMALGYSNQVSEAETQLKRATELDPNYEDAFFKLGRAQSYLGRFDDALKSYRAAMLLNPNDSRLIHAVSRLLATHPEPSKRKPDEALELATRALGLVSTPDLMSLRTLAMAQAATGDFELATMTAELALNRINLHKGRPLGLNIQRQIDFYQQHRIEVVRAGGSKQFVAPSERHSIRRMN